MKPQNLPEAKLAWLIYNKLEQLSSLLWDRYDNDFVSFIMEEKDQEWLSTLSNINPIDQSLAQGSSTNPNVKSTSHP